MAFRVLCYLALWLPWFATGLMAQGMDTLPAAGSWPYQEPSTLKKFSVSGFYRFFGTYTTQQLPYILNPAINDTVLPRSLFIGDDSQLPNLQLTFTGRPAPRTTFSFDVFAFQLMQGNIATSYGSQIPDTLRPSFQDPLSGARLGSTLNLNLGLQFSGSYASRVGLFSIQAGGIQWVRMTDLTMASFRGYNRFILFERNPWDPAGAALESRYQTYYEEGGINQDNRWGNRAFKGLVLQGSRLPKGVDAMILAGKSEFNGGFQPLPGYTYGAMITHRAGADFTHSIQTLQSTTWADSLSLDRVGFDVATWNFTLRKFGFILQAEGGAGRYTAPTYSGGWGGMVSGGITTPKHKNIPVLHIHGFYISPEAINNNSIFLNAAVTEFNPTQLPAGTIGSTAVLQPFGSSMLRIGQMTNNRTGINLNAEHTWRNWKFNIGLSSQAEIEPIASVITYGHPVNQLTRSRFWRWVFPTAVGPYQQYSVIFRDVYETVQLSDDSSGIVVNEKYFYVFEPQIKLKTALFNKDIYLYYLGYYASVQRNWAWWLVTNEEAYIRQYVTEGEAYMELTDHLLLSLYAGYERTLGNYLTDINEETRRPRNQTGTGLGVGFDIDLGNNARLYLRQRWFAFEDTSFELDAFKGTESLVELKIFF